MKLTAMVILAGLAVGQVRAADANKGGKETVTAYIWGEENVPFDVRSRALQTASDVFAEIGVSVKWRHKRPAEGQAQREGAVAIGIVGKTGGSSQQTLAAARPSLMAHTTRDWPLLASPAAKTLCVDEENAPYAAFALPRSSVATPSPERSSCSGPRKPRARRTRSASKYSSLPGISCIAN